MCSNRFRSSQTGAAGEHLVVCIEDQERGGEHCIALGDEVQRGVLPRVGGVVRLHADQLHVQQHLRQPCLAPKV